MSEVIDVIELKLSVSEAQAVLTALSKGSYEEVAPLVEELKGQAQPQADEIQAKIDAAVEGIEDEEEAKAAAAEVDTTVVLEMTTAGVNLALNSLGQFPYVQVAGVIQNIMDQGRPQANLIEEAKAAAEAEEDGAAADAAG